MNTFTPPHPTHENLSKKKEGLFAKARNPFWLAPMAGITDVCFRQLMDEMSAGVLISELVSAKGLFYNSEKTQKMMRVHANSKSIVGIQLFGESAEDIIRASEFVESTGADFIDINLGCPVKKVVKKGCGAALLRDPGLSGNFSFYYKKRHSTSPYSENAYRME